MAATANYHTLGIPFVNSSSPSSHSQGPSSIHSVHSHTNSLSGVVNGSSNVNPSSLSSNGSHNSMPVNGKGQPNYNIHSGSHHPATTSGLNGAIIKTSIQSSRGPSSTSSTVTNALHDKLRHPRGSAGEPGSSDLSDEHEYYNDYNLRLKREMQPLQQTPQILLSLIHI